MIKQQKNIFKIDTVTLSTDIKHFEDSVDKLFQSDYEFIINNFNTTKESDKLIYFYNFDAVNLKFYYSFNTLHITFSPSELLHKEEFTTDDYYILIEKLKSEIFFLKYIDWDNIILNRVDFKVDYYTENIDLYLKLFRKLTRNYNNLKQNNQYETSIYFKSDTKNLQIYDKEKERIDKNEKVLEEHKDLLRYELQLKKQIDCNYRKWGSCKTLFNYITCRDAEFHMKRIFKNIIYQGDFYNIYHSRRILSQHYSTKTVNNLIGFQKDISHSDIDTVRNKLSRQAFNEKIRKLNMAKVSPILIPKNEKFTYLINPIFNKLHT